MAAIDRRTHLGRLIGGIDDILDPDRNAVQGAAIGAAIERARLAERQRRVHMREGVNGGLARRNAGEAIAHHLLGGKRAPAMRLAICVAESALRALRLHGYVQFLRARPAEVPAILPKTAPEMRPEPPG